MTQQDNNASEPKADISDDATVAPAPASDEHGGVTDRHAASGASLIGSRLGGYLILNRLGRGGMADVYAAKDTSLDRDVALKLLRPDMARDREYITRFKREARAAAKLNHPNIVGIYEVGADAGRHYIVQELIDGMNLREMLDRNGACSPEQAVEILFGVASALNAAATEGITHRDIKPENVMNSSSGVVKVADFGLARLGDDADGSRADLTQAGLTLGTPRYMSPEQVQGKPVDPRSDLYSLGVMMYHLLAGRPPFQADDALALAFSHVNETPEPLDHARGDAELPEWLIAIVSKLMRKDPNQRFQSPAELLETLTGDDSATKIGSSTMIGAATATARLQRVADEHKRTVRRKRIRSALIALLPIACIGIGAFAMSMTPPTTIGGILAKRSSTSPESVEQMETIEGQFLHAVDRNEPAAWKAVEYYFPPSENAFNRSYATKAMLQLANHYKTEEEYENALSTLQELLITPQTAKKYQLVALAYQTDVLKRMGMSKKLQDCKRQYETLRKDLMGSNPDAIEWFDQVIPPRVQGDIGLPRVE